MRRNHKTSPPERTAPAVQPLKKKMESAEFQQRSSDFIVGGIGTNTLTVLDWTEYLSPNRKVDFGPLQKSMVDAIENIRNGDLGSAETILMSQAISLNVVFTKLLRYAHTTNLVEQLDRYMRLAMKAQNQCRATLETLATIKNPPLFAKQANITAGPQQVNNGIVTNGVARAGIQESAPNKLLESHVERLDGSTPAKAAKGNQTVGALEERNRPANPRRKAASVTQRLPRR